MGFASFILGAVLQSMLALLLAPGVSSPLAAAPQPSLTYAAVPASGEWLLQLMPSCNGIRTLPQPAVFSWPNLDRRRRQLTGSNWGYFTCMQTPDAAARFYRERLTKAPYQMKEISWVARREGTLGIFHNPYSYTWIYLWVVPQPGSPQNAMLVVAQNFGSGVAFVCRLPYRPGNFMDVL